MKQENLFMTQFKHHVQGNLFPQVQMLIISGTYDSQKYTSCPGWCGSVD